MPGKLQLAEAPVQPKVVYRKMPGDALSAAGNSMEPARKRPRTSTSSLSATASSSKDAEPATSSRNWISTLPIELVIRIFVLCDGDSITLARLECVCRQWRHILKHTPKPWERVHLWEPPLSFINTAIAINDVPAEPMSSYSGRVVLKALGRAAQRTKNKIVSVRIDLRRRCNGEEANKVELCLRDSRDSLRALSIHASTPTFGRWLPCMALPHLESFVLFGGQRGMSPVPRTMTFDKIAANSKIRELMVSGPTTLICGIPALRTWVQEYSIPEQDNPNRFLEAIERSRSTLQHLRIQSVGQLNEDSPPDQPMMTLPRLHSFEATAKQPLGPSSVSRRLYAPSLRILSVVSARHDQLHDLYAGFCDLSRLEELSISFAESPITPTSRVAALQFFSKLQKLRKLDISAEGQTAVLDQIVACMAPAEWQRESARIPGLAGPSFLPAVKTLIIRKHPHMTGSPLMRVVAARLKRDSASARPNNGSERSVAPAISAPAARQTNSAFKTNSSSAFKRATSAFSSASSSMRAPPTSLSIQPQTSSAVRLPEVEALSTVILHRCPMLDPQAVAWLENQVPTFAHIDQDRLARQRAEASSRSIRPW